MADETVRRRQVVAKVYQPCEQCGHDTLDLVQSRRVGAGPQPLRWLRRARTRRYVRCPSCDFRTAAVGHPSKRVSALGWLLVGLLGLLVLVETLVLAAMTTLISVPLALVPVVAVGVLVGLIIWDARRHSRG